MIYIVSYPRSGNTWVRFLLSNLLYPNEDVNWRSINRFIPDLHQKHAWAREGVRNPQFIKSHFKFKEDYQRVVYLYRDGRDVAISLYYFHMLDEKGLSFDEFLHRKFIPGQLLFGDWKSHVAFWLFENHGIEFLPIRYEDLIENPTAGVEKVVDFSGLSVRSEILNEAILKSDYKKLREIRPRDGVHPKLGGLRGTSGGWRKTFTKSQSERFWDYAGDLMEKLGYKKEE